MLHLPCICPRARQKIEKEKYIILFILTNKFQSVCAKRLKALQRVSWSQSFLFNYQNCKLFLITFYISSMFNIVAISITEMHGGTNCLRYQALLSKTQFKTSIYGFDFQYCLRKHYWSCLVSVIAFNICILLIGLLLLRQCVTGNLRYSVLCGIPEFRTSGP